MAPSPFGDMFASEPLQLLGCQGLELLDWFGGQLQQMHDEVLAEDILRGSEGAPDAVRDKILAELFGIGRPKAGKCCDPGAGATEATATKDAGETSPKQAAGEDKETTAQAEKQTKRNRCPKRHDGLGILGWFNEHLSKMEEELFKDEPSSSTTSPADIRARVAEKLRNRREEPQAKEKQSTQDQAVPEEKMTTAKGASETTNEATVAAAGESASEPKKEAPLAKVIPNSEQAQKQPQAEPDKAVIRSPPKDDGQQTVQANQDEGQQTQRGVLHDDASAAVHTDAWTPRRIDREQHIEWHFGGDSWFEPEDVKIDVEGTTAILVISRKETVRMQDAVGEAGPAEFTSYREVRRTIALPESVDVSKLTARFIPGSRIVVLSAPRILEQDTRDSGLIPIKIIRKNQIQPSN